MKTKRNNTIMYTIEKKIVEVMERKRLMWYGNLRRIEEGKSPKTVKKRVIRT